MAVRTAVLLASLALAGGAKKRKPAEVPATDCIVTSTALDGTEETRDCFLLSESFSQPGTKGRFESCTQ